VTLRNGKQALIREIRPEDKAGVLAAFHRLSEDSRYTRFLASMNELPDALLESAVHPIPKRECALVAMAGTEDAGDLIGGARFSIDPGTGCCEFAVTILDGWHGLGLARILMQMLIPLARADGYRTMIGYVLASNTAMRGLAHRLGFKDKMCLDDATLREVILDLTESPPPKHETSHHDPHAGCH
jgi:RimJ/RimL family protein N-acetyltransferase